MMNEILNNSELKPYQKTSYFLLMIAVVIGGAGLILATSLYLPNVAFLTDVQRGQILETMFNGWLTMSGIVAGGNVVARGGVTLLKQWLQNELAKNAAGVDDKPETINAGGDVNMGSNSPDKANNQGSTPNRPPTAISESIEWREEMPGDVPQGRGAPYVPRELTVEQLPDAIASGAVTLGGVAGTVSNMTVSTPLDRIDDNAFNPDAARELQAEAVIEQEAQHGSN